MARFARRTTVVGVAVSLMLAVALVVAPMAMAIMVPTSVRVDNNTNTYVPDNSFRDVPFVVSGATGSVADVRFSLYLTCTWDSDVDLLLIAPDGTSVDLTSDNGGASDDYGTGVSDATRTLFTDSAPTIITAGTAPFVGSYRPESPLSAFDGRNPNGTWTLRVTDDAGGDVTTFVAGSLFIDLGTGDGAAPVITAPADITAEATGPNGAAVSFSASAVDAVDGAVTCYASPASGSTFPIGTTTVQLSACDTAGNWSYSSFTVTVVDTTAPLISPPSDFSVSAVSAAGAGVAFQASANDIVDGAVGVTYWLDYGMWNQSQITSPYMFPHGASTVTCVAVDTAGNTASSTFMVSVSWVNAIQQAIDELTALMPTLRSSVDRANVSDAIGHLQGALVKSLWKDGSHPADGLFGGEVVFNECKAAAEHLRRCGEASSQLKATLARVCTVCRGIAELQIAESSQAGGNARKLSAARAALAKGDQWAVGNASVAIDYYKEAWKQAAGSLLVPR